MTALLEHFDAVAIDLDGTLIDSVHDLVAAAQKMLQELGLPAVSSKDIGGFVGNGVEALVRRILLATGETVTNDLLEQALACFRRFYAENLFTHSQVFPGVLQGLEALRGMGLRMCCITNKSSQFTRPLLIQAGLEHYFDEVYCADLPTQRKPAAWLLEQACATFDIQPERLLMVGDSCSDVAAARMAGCKVVAVDYGYNHGRPIAEENADWIVSSLEELEQLFDTKSKSTRVWVSKEAPL